MSEVNPYSGPQSNVASAEEGVGTIKIFSLSGRLNRLRYFVYLSVAGVIAQVVQVPLGFAAAGMLQNAVAVAGIAAVVVLLVFLVFTVCFTVQRMHDFNVSGWWCLVLLLPMALLGAASAIMDPALLAAGMASSTMSIGGAVAFVVLVVSVLALYFFPGTAGANRFGRPPPPNSTAVKVLAWIIVGLYVVGVIAAIAIPMLMTPPGAGQ